MSLVRRGRWITLVALVLLAGVYVRALAFTPIERLQGPAQKIFYLHVPAAIWTEAAMILVGLAGIFFLFLGTRAWTGSPRPRRRWVPCSPRSCSPQGRSGESRSGER